MYRSSFGLFLQCWQKGQNLPSKRSEKSQNFLHFCQNPIVGALANASDKYILSFISVRSFDGPEGVKNMKGG